MSYIYEALKRAEDERQQGAVTARPAGRPLSFVTRPPWWVWGLLGALIANVALLVVLTFTRAPSSAPTAVIGAVPLADQPAKPASPTISASRIEAPAAPAAPRASAPPVTAPAPRDRTTPGVTTPAPRAVVPPPVVAPPVATPAPRAVVPPPVVAPPGVVAPPAPAVAAVAPRVVAPAPGVAAPRPVTSEDAPKLLLQVLVYADVPSQRMVFINGRRYVEGDQIDADTTLERITPDGAVVNRHGQRFTITDRR